MTQLYLLEMAFLHYILSHFTLLIHLYFQYFTITAKPLEVTVGPLFKSMSSVEWMVLNVFLKWFERFPSPTAKLTLPVGFLKCPRTIPSLPHRNLAWQVGHPSCTILCVKPYHTLTYWGSPLTLTVHDMEIISANFNLQWRYFEIPSGYGPSW